MRTRSWRLAHRRIFIGRLGGKGFFLGVWVGLWGRERGFGGLRGKGKREGVGGDGGLRSEVWRMDEKDRWDAHGG